MLLYITYRYNTPITIEELGSNGYQSITTENDNSFKTDLLLTFGDRLENFCTGNYNKHEIEEFYSINRLKIKTNENDYQFCVVMNEHGSPENFNRDLKEYFSSSDKSYFNKMMQYTISTTRPVSF